jgi:hypothetical protein
LPSDAEWNDLEVEIALSAEGVYSSIGPTSWTEYHGTPRTMYGFRGEHGPKMTSPTVVTWDGEQYGASKPAEDGGFCGIHAGTVQNGGAYDALLMEWWSASSYVREDQTREAYIRKVYNSHLSCVRERQYCDHLRTVRCKLNN